ncbi:MAG: phosphatidic acid phosphatase [Dehalococcoidales bacterium]
MRRQIANLTSNILNPFLVSPATILLLAFKSTTTISDAIKWSLISIAVSILPVFLIIVYLVHHERLESIFTNIRRERNKIYLLASAFATAGGVILFYLGAPLVLIAIFVAGLSATLIFMSINFRWKISLHTAFIAALITVLVILYGSIGIASIVLLPPIAWARVELEHHSIAQVVTGALLAALIVVVVFHLFGLIGSITPL